MHAIANPLLAERIIQLNNHPLRVDILLPVIDSLPLRKKGLGSAVAGPFSSVLRKHTLLSQRPFHPGWVLANFLKRKESYP